MTTTRKTNISSLLRTLLGTAVLAAAALSYAGSASAIGDFPGGGTNGTSLDGVEPAAGCIVQSATEASPAILLAVGGPNGTGGLNGTSRDGIAPAAGCIVQSAAEVAPVILLAAGGPLGTGGVNGTSRDGIEPAAGCVVQPATGGGTGLAR